MANSMTPSEIIDTSEIIDAYHPGKLLYKTQDDTLQLFLDYEIRSSWWADLIWFKWGQELTGRYFAWKVKNKYKRYLNSKQEEERLRNKFSFHNLRIGNYIQGYVK